MRKPLKIHNYSKYASWSFTLDPLSGVMICFITFIGFLIHLYSVGYMAHDKSYARFFCYLNLFMGSMLLLVMGSSLPVMFVGWEGVGFCSYLLIGFYTDRQFDPETGMTCADAGRKAFLTNRIGDFFFMSGMLIAFANFGTLTFAGLEQAIHGGGASQGILLAIALLMFAGATAKSAQIPLYVWLPDAMAGPTPVSALIHAATMVTAGVYMVCRMYFLYAQVPAAQAIIALTGAATALFAATMGITATDIKKVLAYSTVSQLGYMFIGVGVGVPAAGLFHVFTHAFFKALLFLAAGSVIHALSGEQNIFNMGKLFRKIPLTAATFLVGVLAIAGLPGLSGFFSKDEILFRAYTTEIFAQAGAGWLALPVYLMALAAAGLTAFYMFRLFFLVFTGKNNVSAEAESHIHESPWTMTLPLVLLAVGAIFAGYLAPGFGHAGLWNEFLAPVFGGHEAAHASHTLEYALAAVSVGVALIGALFAWRMYATGTERAAAAAARSPGLHATLRNRYYVDEGYEALFLGPLRRSAEMIESFDRWFVDGAVNVVAFGNELAGVFLRFLQTGLVRDYGVIFALSATALLVWAMAGA